MPVDPVLDDLRREYQAGRLILFAGAGVSMSAGLPSWKTLVDALAAHARGRDASADVLREIEDLTAKGQLIEALSAAKDALGGPEYGLVVERALNDAGRDVPAVAHAIAS